MIRPFVLASASPRRSALLRSVGLTFSVAPADVDETVRHGELPKAYARRVARAKVTAVPGACVLAADTVVALDTDVLGKPLGVEEAAETLARLSGKTHRVHTAVALRVGGHVHQHMSTTLVVFRALTPDDIARYVATGEPLDKAGAYGIQGEGGTLVDYVRGSYTNVIGLPLRETLGLLERWAG